MENCGIVAEKKQTERNLIKQKIQNSFCIQKIQEILRQVFLTQVPWALIIKSSNDVY